MVYWWHSDRWSLWKWACCLCTRGRTALGMEELSSDTNEEKDHAGMSMLRADWVCSFPLYRAENHRYWSHSLGSNRCPVTAGSTLTTVMTQEPFLKNPECVWLLCLTQASDIWSIREVWVQLRKESWSQTSKSDFTPEAELSRNDMLLLTGLN